MCVGTWRVENTYFCSCGKRFSFLLVYQNKHKCASQCLEGFRITLRNKEKHNISFKKLTPVVLTVLGFAGYRRLSIPAHRRVFYLGVGDLLPKSALFSAVTLGTCLKDSRKTAQLGSGTVSRCAFFLQL